MKKTLTRLLLLASMTASAQPPVFTNLDIVPGSGSSAGYVLGEANGKILISAADANHGIELYANDGTTTGTTLIKDIRPGTGHGIDLFGYVVYNGKLYFTANDGTNGVEIWYSDGTAAGTQMLKDINPGAASAFNQTNYMAVSAGKLYFTADNGINGYELWVSDGTTAGTVLLKDIEAGSGGSYPREFTELNGKTIFAAKTTANGTELWTTDGTSAGTQIVLDIYAGGTNGAVPQLLTKFHNEVFFVAQSNVDGFEMWHTDGTAAGTFMLKDINPSGDGLLNTELKVVGDNLFFVADDGVNGTELWTTDGTSANTKMVIDANPGSAGSTIRYLAACLGKLYYRVTLPATGSEPWTSDGTTAGTTILKDLLTGTGHGLTTNPMFTQYKKYTYFMGQSASGDIQLWQTDGTAINTKIVAPAISPIANPLNNGIRFFNTAKDSSMYFTANYDFTGLELWKITDTTSHPNSIASTTGSTANVRIYPNPAHNSFTIKTNTTFRQGNITLTDITGRMVKTETIYNNEQTISLQDIAPGIYMADVWLDDKRSTQKLIVE